MWTHPFEPIFNQNSRILILGTFPSIKSRVSNFYYGNPQNRFWRVIAHLTNTFPVPETIVEKIKMLLQNGISIWDIIKSCDIDASYDNSIKNVIPNDITFILKSSNVQKIYANGSKAYDLCKKYGVNALKLPSTSSANAKYSLGKLIEAWDIM